MTVTDLIYFGINYRFTYTDFALQIPALVIGYRHSFRNWKIEVIQSASQSVVWSGKSVTLSVIGGVSGLHLQTFFWGEHGYGCRLLEI